jgi:HlyD family secretion protein
MLKVNSTVVTLGVAGILAIVVGFYVNNVSWKPVGEQKTQAGTQKTNTGDVSASASEHPTWAASATGRVEPKGGEVRITAEVPGSIEDIPVALNDVLKGGDLLIRLDDEDALTKVVAANAEAAVRERERNEDDARGLALERRNAEDAVASAERALFGARQAFDDALKGAYRERLG